MTDRPTIDASAADLDLVMTEGDPIAFNFLVLDASSWATSAFRCHVKATADVDDVVLADITVVVTAESANLDVLMTSAPVPALTARIGTFYWDLQEDGGLTRFSGLFVVRKQVTA